MMEPIPEATARIEARMSRLSSDEVAARLAEASVAYVPIGSLEFHGPHLPLGVDLFTAEGLCLEAAQRSGGVVLPPVYLANGCLDLPHSLTFHPSLVEAWSGAVIDQLHHRGVALVVLVTGHGPLDLIHLLKRVAGERERDGARAYALCWLELNAARLTEPQLDEPTVIDHASTVETSWMLALEPSLVHLSQLSDDPEALTVGVYGRNPRFTASDTIGREQIDACAEVLALRVAGLRGGVWSDELNDLRAFVDFAWPEPLTAYPTRDAGGCLVIVLHNPGRASRFLTSIESAHIGGRELDLAGAFCFNSSAGETGLSVPCSDLGPESGIYVRRGQDLTVSVPSERDPLPEGEIRVTVVLGGVRRRDLASAVVNDHDSASVLDARTTPAYVRAADLERVPESDPD